jgi:aconitate hydratase
VAVIARSFARIHETNLKKQGMLALTFADPAMYDEIDVEDKLDVVAADEIEPGRNLVLKVRRPDGGCWEAELVHSYHEGQIAWLKEGSALNAVKAGRVDC